MLEKSLNCNWLNPVSEPRQTLAFLLLVAGCSGDAIAPEPPPPQNRPPVLTGEIPQQSLWAGDRIGVGVSRHFSDPDGDSLTFTASSSDLSVVTANIEAGTLVILTGLASGEAVATVTARDPGGLEASATFAVVVSESPDRAVLVAFYHATDGPNWRRSDNWLTDAPLSEWYGVQISVGRVLGLKLKDNNLTGPIPPC